MYQALYLILDSNESSDAYFCRSLVLDQLKSQKTDCSNIHHDRGPIKMQFWWSCVSTPTPTFFF